MKRLRQGLMFVGLATLTIVAIVWFRLDAIAQQSLEQNLSRVLGVPTQISALHIKKIAGQAHIKTLTIDNPQGFSDKKIFQVDDIDVTFQPWSLLRPTLDIQDLLLDRIDVNFEQTLQNNNILEIINHVKGRQQSSTAPRIVSAQLSFKGKRFEIRRAVLDNIVVMVNLAPLGNLIPFGGFSKATEIKVPRIELQDLTSENAQAVLEGTLNEVVSNLLNTLAGDLFQEIPRQMESDGNKGILGDLLDKLPF